MAKAVFVLALSISISICASLPSYAATTPKKTPTWGELTSEQQQILAPLSEDWNNFEPARKRKWIGIAKRYPKMKPDEQTRVQRRMQAWASLTPKEREAARERYKKMEKLPPDKKKKLPQKWEEYNRLPEGEKQNLGASQRKALPPKAASSPAPRPSPAPITNPATPAPAAR